METTGNKKYEKLLAVVFIFGLIYMGMATRGCIQSYLDNAQEEETCRNACSLRDANLKMQANNLCICDNNVVLTYTPEAIWQEK